MRAGETKRGARLRLRYGITERKFNQLVRAQRGRCPICLRPFKEIKGRPNLDHNHKTGEIRGVLCGYCNQRVVWRHTDVAKLKRLVSYMEQGTGLFVPIKKKRRKKRKQRHKKRR
jgi:hypothetical protein